jgi:hypothetical protein
MRQNAVLVLIAAASLCVASATYTGYSGAPGTLGTCAGLCHGTSGGTITVSGFPATYVPGQAYVVTVAHNGGSSIDNFNASVRVGTGPANAGTITAGTNTAVYSVTGETNGVHFGSPGQASGTFTWTAPSPGVGTVSLYLSGHQGGTQNGPNTEFVLTAGAASITESGRPARIASAFTVEPSVARTALVFRAASVTRMTSVRIVGRDGRCVARVSIRAGKDVAVSWPLLDRDGRRLPAGIYHAVLATDGGLLARRFVVTGE